MRQEFRERKRATISTYKSSFTSTIKNRNIKLESFSQTQVNTVMEKIDTLLVEAEESTTMSAANQENRISILLAFQEIFADLEIE